jgi:hypothetical protein
MFRRVCEGRCERVGSAIVRPFAALLRAKRLASAWERCACVGAFGLSGSSALERVGRGLKRIGCNQSATSSSLVDQVWVLTLKQWEARLKSKSQSPVDRVWVLTPRPLSPESAVAWRGGLAKPCRQPV